MSKVFKQALRSLSLPDWALVLCTRDGAGSTGCCAVPVTLERSRFLQSIIFYPVARATPGSGLFDARRFVVYLHSFSKGAQVGYLFSNMEIISMYSQIHHHRPTASQMLIKSFTITAYRFSVIPAIRTSIILREKSRLRKSSQCPKLPALIFFLRVSNGRESLSKYR